MMQNPDQKENTRLSEEMLNKYASDGLPKAGGFDAAEVLSILRLADAEDWKLSGTLQEHQFRNIRDSLSKMHVSDGYFLNYGESELIPKLSPEDWEAILSEGQENRREGFLRTVSFPASGIYAVEGEHLYLSVKTGNNAGAKLTSKLTSRKNGNVTCRQRSCGYIPMYSSLFKKRAAHALLFFSHSDRIAGLMRSGRSSACISSRCRRGRDRCVRSLV